MKILVHDAIGVWLATRLLNCGRFAWLKDVSGKLTLSRAQNVRAVVGPALATLVRSRCDHLAVASILASADRWCERQRARSLTLIDEGLDTPNPEQRCQALRASRAEVAFKQAVVDKLSHENLILRRLKFAANYEAYSFEQKNLLEDALDSDLAAVAAEIEGI